MPNHSRRVIIQLNKFIYTTKHLGEMIEVFSALTRGLEFEP